MPKPDITPEKAKNLDKLATYLEGLPEDYALFDMQNYAKEEGCGTVACACGHGPMAGIKREGYEQWADYANRVFGVSALYRDWHFLFSGIWHLIQPTHHQAAARIRVFLKDGVPDAFSGDDPYEAYAQSLEQPND